MKNSILKIFQKKGKQSKQRTAVVTNYKNAKKVGVLYRVRDVEQEQLLGQYVKYLKVEKGIDQVEVLGFYNGKKLPEFASGQTEFSYFTLRDFNWFKRPKTTSVKRFIVEDYDILIDLSPKEETLTHFIVNHSRAKLKVGKFYGGKDSLYDLMIDVKDSTDLNYLINQVNHYLSLINKEEVL